MRIDAEVKCVATPTHCGRTFTMADDNRVALLHAAAYTIQLQPTLHMAAASASLWLQVRGALGGRGARRQGQRESRVAALQRHRLRAHRWTARAYAERLDCPRGPRPRSFRKLKRFWTTLLERHARPAPEYLGLQPWTPEVAALDT
eukprot:scaffold66555_cov63-Phaeocystis_antarctica.AAC.2